MLTVWAKSSAFVHAVTHVISWKVNNVVLTWCWNISQIAICTNCDKMKWRICADCNPRGQAQVKFATWLWLFKCCASPDISTCWNPWLVNCCWGGKFEIMKNLALRQFHRTPVYTTCAACVVHFTLDLWSLQKDANIFHSFWRDCQLSSERVACAETCVLLSLPM